jgi:hypothetical protein
MRALERAKHLQEDWCKRPIGRTTKRLKRAVGPIVEARRTKTFAKIKYSETSHDDSINGLSGGKNNTRQAEAPNDST